MTIEERTAAFVEAIEKSCCPNCGGALKVTDITTKNLLEMIGIVFHVECKLCDYTAPPAPSKIEALKQHDRKVISLLRPFKIVGNFNGDTFPEFLNRKMN